MPWSIYKRGENAIRGAALQVLLPSLDIIVRCAPHPQQKEPKKIPALRNGMIFSWLQVHNIFFASFF
jgi:hypothetical protein